MSPGLEHLTLYVVTSLTTNGKNSFTWSTYQSIVCWISNYLAKRISSDRRQCLSVIRSSGALWDPTELCVARVHYCYVDDLASAVQSLCSKVNLFADNILLYHIISNTLDYATLQLAVSLIEEWSVSNFLCFNVSKCKSSPETFSNYSTKFSGTLWKSTAES